MKAKTIYVNLGAGQHTPIEPFVAHTKPVPLGTPFKVIRVSDLDKVIEGAAKALFLAETEPGKRPASFAKATRWLQDHYRRLARAAYKAGGLLP